MYCTTRLLRYILCVINLIYALNGCLLIWYGTWLLNSIAEQRNAVDHGEKLAAILCILLGIVIVLASIFGTVALAKECKKMLISYAVLLLLLLVIQFIMFSISFAASRDALPNSLKQGFDELWDPKRSINSTLSVYEEWLHCCGRNSAEDYILLEREIPASCCFELDCTKPSNLFMDGCESQFKQYVSKKSANFHTITWLIILTEFVGSVCTCYLVDSIRNHRDRVRFYN
ncbi:protein late bloomer [Drosophila grimshawi]|uniref:Tetraspanin n=1 Tax=Drosophila grimshawi TaxID=7222 RepID=B4J3X1_DROGR|nr:protein late bloomer [Drosophila grimshawi]EDW01554.1 GH21502 [Drosophila grimshawi]